MKKIPDNHHKETNRRIFIKNSLSGLAFLGLGSIFPSCSRKEYYSQDDFIPAPKTDVHFHYNVSDDALLKYMTSVNMRILTINTDTGRPVDSQLTVAQSLQKTYPNRISFIGTFTLASFGTATFADDVIAQIKKCVVAGAKGIKIWKNIGMVLQDNHGKYVMADDPAFAPVFAYIEKERIPLLAHLGEPRNCWLPYDQITTAGDYHYYKNHPQYHMYQHPEAPSYEKHIAARDHLLEKYPQLVFTGAHLGSLEWNVDEVARRLDKYPNFTVDLSARMNHVLLQTAENREKVRNFFIKYQGRMMYGSDMAWDEKTIVNVDRSCQTLYDLWQSHWLFLATDQMFPVEKFNVKNVPEAIQGLRLPAKVVDKIFHTNAIRIFSI